MKNKKVARRLAALLLIISLCAVAAVADTIRLKDGTVIRGQIIGFRDQQFTVLIGSGARGRRSRITLYMEDVDSIEFDNSAGGATAGAPTGSVGSGDTDSATANSEPPARVPTTTRPSPVDPRSTAGAGTTNTPASPRPTSSSMPPSSAPGSPAFFQINVRVRAHKTANGWTKIGHDVRRGQRLRINSSGRVALGGGRFSTPTGLPRVSDESKLMRTEPTGGLIAVIGDDNDEFIFVGSNRDFVAQRDGVLFLGVNESNLSDNSGAYETVVEAEAVSSSAAR